MKKFIAAALLFVSAFAFSQSGNEILNNYKFAIVPSKFDFLKEKDQYQLNTFTKMYMEKYGFKVFFDTDPLPLEVMGNNCNKVFVELISESNMFMTKINVVLRDCMNKELYRTDVGKSRDKQYRTAYREALREAFKSFDTLDYTYNGGNGISSTAAQAAAPAAAPIPDKKPVVIDKNTLFAQPAENGYQLVDTTPKVIFKLQKTSSSKVFLAQKEGLSGTLIEKEDGKWVFEHYVNGQLVTENISIKF